MSQQIRQLAAQIAQEHGIPVEPFLRLIEIEAGFDPNAFNDGSRASGLGQFIPSTARAYGLTNPFDPVQNLRATAKLWLDNERYLTQALGSPPEPWMQYLAHQQGMGGAVKLLRNPDAPAAQAVGASAVTSNGGSGGMTAAQFAGMWRDKFNKGGNFGGSSSEYDYAGGYDASAFGVRNPLEGGFGGEIASRSVGGGLGARTLGESAPYGITGASDPFMRLMRIASGEYNPYRQSAYNPYPGAQSNPYGMGYGAASFGGDPYLQGGAY